MTVIEPLPIHVFDWCKLAHEFVGEAIEDYGWGINEEDLHRTYHAWDKKNFGWLLEHRGQIVGVLAGVVIPHFFNYSNRIFNEFMWYVKPEFRGTGGGLMLYRACLRRCNALGIERLVFGHTRYMSEEFGKIYERLGFTYLETHYEKVLNGGK